MRAAIYSGEAPTGGFLWLADLEEAMPPTFKVQVRPLLQK
jgi:hypothetical protein